MEDLSVKKVPMHLQSSQNRILIKGGTVVNATGSESADVYIEDRLIKQVGSNLDIPGGTRIIDASGKLVMPGGIDTHTVRLVFKDSTSRFDEIFLAPKKSRQMAARIASIIFRISNLDLFSIAKCHLWGLGPSTIFMLVPKLRWLVEPL